MRDLHASTREPPPQFMEPTTGVIFDWNRRIFPRNRERHRASHNGAPIGIGRSDPCLRRMAKARLGEAGAQAPRDDNCRHATPVLPAAGAVVALSAQGGRSGHAQSRLDPERVAIGCVRFAPPRPEPAAQPPCRRTVQSAPNSAAFWSVLRDATPAAPLLRTRRPARFLQTAARASRMRVIPPRSTPSRTPAPRARPLRRPRRAYRAPSRCRSRRRPRVDRGRCARA